MSKWIDRTWKEVIIENIDDAILFFKPDLAMDRDYEKKPFLIDTEHPAIGGVSDKGGRISDLCVSVPLITGAEKRVAFQVEQQHKKDKELGLKVFQNYYRASDQLQIPVTSLAIFTGPDKAIDTYSSLCYGTELNFRYSIYHVASANEEELKKDDRLFALVVLATRRMLDAGKDPGDRGRYSLELLSLMKEKNYDLKRTRSVQKFVYRILRLGSKKIDPKVKEVWKVHMIPIDQAVREIQIRDAKAEGKAEGRTEGRTEGKAEGQRKVARNLLEMGWDLEKVMRVSELPREDIEALLIN
ncbi:MAG: hypothetical protein LBJ36_10600 [Synergistaceae bacterium]|jgi:predicted transposase/invertase (TIGR01784 family)|nr:hypothetical protein [Synergistaceae bacterium]